MKVSVVIPAYNEEGFLKQTLASIINQKEGADEIIVVDNNSTDKTASIAKHFGVKVIPEEKQGTTPARNKGFDSAKYEIIVRSDADVIVPNDWIKRIKLHFGTKRIDALSGPVAFYDSRLVTKSALPAKILYKSLGAITKGKKYLLGPNMSLTSEIWQKVRDKVNLDDKKVHEDIDLTLNIYKVGGVIEFDPKLIVKSSARRITKNPRSFFFEYPVRVVKTFIENE